MQRFGVALIIAAGLAAGWGGGRKKSSRGRSRAEGAPASQAGGGTQQASAQGKQVFTQNCAGCHTLAAAQSNGQAVPNLDQLKPDRATVRRQVITGGKPGGMPSFKGSLTNAQINAVAQYVSGVAGQ